LVHRDIWEVEGGATADHTVSHCARRRGLGCV
jgi:hypothetical protein